MWHVFVSVRCSRRSVHLQLQEQFTRAKSQSPVYCCPPVPHHHVAAAPAGWHCFVGHVSEHTCEHTTPVQCGYALGRSEVLCQPRSCTAGVDDSSQHVAASADQLQCCTVLFGTFTPPALQ
jgi:hypothetical protein